MAAAGSALPGGPRFPPSSAELLPFWMVLGVSSVGLCSMGYFVLRECVRCRTFKRLLPDERTRTVLRVV